MCIQLRCVCLFLYKEFTLKDVDHLSTPIFILQSSVLMSLCIKWQKCVHSHFRNYWKFSNHKPNFTGQCARGSGGSGTGVPQRSESSLVVRVLCFHLYLSFKQQTQVVELTVLLVSP